MNRYPYCNRKIGLNLAYRRGLLRLNQQALASTLGLAREAISEIERGRRQLTLAEAIVLEEKRNITLAHLADGTPIAH